MDSCHSHKRKQLSIVQYIYTYSSSRLLYSSIPPSPSSFIQSEKICGKWHVLVSVPAARWGGVEAGNELYVHLGNSKRVKLAC